MTEEARPLIAIVDQNMDWAETMAQLFELNGMTAVAFFAQSNTWELTNEIDQKVPDLVISGAIIAGETDPESGLKMAGDLQQLGYPVLLMSDPHFRKAIEAAGFQFLDKAEAANVPAFLAIVRAILES